MDTHKDISQRPCHSLFLGWKVTVVLLAALLLPLRFACANDAGIEEQLKSEYGSKVLTLRHFYSGDHLRFYSDGALKGDAPTGPWTVDGQIAVEEINLRGGFVVIKGRRVYRIFDTQLKPQDELTTIDNYYGKLREDLEHTLRSLKTEIEIELPSGKPDQKDISSAIHAVFLADSESMMDVTPAFWRAYFAKLEDKPQSAPTTKGPIYILHPHEMSPPHPTWDPEPEYSLQARKVKYEGTAIISLVVDASGATRDLQITRPLGLGLDENAVAAVSTWKFEPAQKDGKPVSVWIAVEVHFHLY